MSRFQVGEHIEVDIATIIGPGGALAGLGRDPRCAYWAAAAITSIENPAERTYSVIVLTAPGERTNIVVPRVREEHIRPRRPS